MRCVMQDVHGLGSSQPLNPEETQKYQEDYQKSFELFQNAFAEYNKPNVEYHKKMQLKKVMDEALQVMNETASAVLKESKQAKEQILSQDYEVYISDPSEKNKNKIVDDIDGLK